MDLGKYEIETYFVVTNGTTEQRSRIVYTGNNEEIFFIERYYGDIREGYKNSNTMFNNLTWLNIKTHIIGESIMVTDNINQPQIYFNISSIESLQKDANNRLIVVDNQLEPIVLEFISPFDRNQAYSIFNLLLQNPFTNLNEIESDITPPTIFFNLEFFGQPILLGNSDESGPFSSDDGDLFRVNIDLSTWSRSLPITKLDIVENMIYDIIDNRDEISLTEGDILIYKDVISFDNIVESISDIGTFICKFNLQDLGQNQITSTIIFTIL